MKIKCEVAQCIWEYNGECLRRYILSINKKGGCGNFRPPMNETEKEEVRKMMQEEEWDV